VSAVFLFGEKTTVPRVQKNFTRLMTPPLPPFYSFCCTNAKDKIYIIKDKFPRISNKVPTYQTFWN
jgi:hypothetical protein